MYVKIACCNNKINKVYIKIYENQKLIIEKNISLNGYIFLKQNKTYRINAMSSIGDINTTFITNKNLKTILLTFKSTYSYITLTILDKYYPEDYIKKGVISLWQNMT